MKTAILYYSQSGITKTIANTIKATLGSDVYFAEPDKEYGGYFSAVVKAGGEKISKKYPAVKLDITDYTGYDAVFIGFPVWYGTMPKFMQEYLKKCNFSGVKVIPFATAGSGGKESSLKTIKELLPKSEVTNYYFTTSPKKPETEEWLNTLSL
ncbi:MAG: hypothetical protein LUG95_06380 [Clostridiales bacterium]|nr:hypothetical protein [Clostridiales bacterium]